MVILKQILKWVKSQNDNLEVHRKEVVLNDILNVFTKQLNASMKHNNIHLRNSIPSDFKVITDENVLMLILHSLIENEVKHNSDCTIQIDAISTKRSTLIEIRNNNTTSLDVNMINRFFQSNSDPKIDSSYLFKGLGLWIVKDLLKKVNAQIKYFRETKRSHKVQIEILK